MFKFITGVALGVFAGAMVLEIVGRKRPDILEKIEGKARETADRVQQRARARQAAARDYDVSAAVDANF